MPYRVIGIVQEFRFPLQAKQLADRVEERVKLEERLRAQPSEECENSSDSESERERSEQQKAREEHMKALQVERERKMQGDQSRHHPLQSCLYFAHDVISFSFNFRTSTTSALPRATRARRRRAQW